MVQCFHRIMHIILYVSVFVCLAFETGFLCVALIILELDLPSRVLGLKAYTTLSVLFYFMSYLYVVQESLEILILLPQPPRQLGLLV